MSAPAFGWIRRPSYRVEYLCSFRPVWREVEGAPETENFNEAVGLAAAVFPMRAGRPVRVVDDTGKTCFSLPAEGIDLERV